MAHLFHPPPNRPIDEDAPQGAFPGATAPLTVTEGTIDRSVFNFGVKTPYGDSVEPDSSTYALTYAGQDLDAPSSSSTDEDRSRPILYSVERAGGSELDRTTCADQCSGGVPA